MRKPRILSESYVYYKKCVRQTNHSRMSGHQNYHKERSSLRLAKSSTELNLSIVFHCSLDFILRTMPHTLAHIHTLLVTTNL